MTQIQDLRDKLFAAKQEIEAWEKSMANAKQDAQRLLADGDREGLLAVNDRYLSLQQQKEDRESDVTLITHAMQMHYQDVTEGRERIDFTLSLVPGEVWSGWHSRYEKGWVIEIDRHLVEQECKVIRAICGLSSLFTSQSKKTQNAPIQLISEYYAYRDTCKSDHSGQWLWEKLAPILPKDQVVKPLDIARLAVLS